MLVARVIAMMRVMVRRIVTSVPITRGNGLQGSTLCSVLSLIYPVFIAPLQGIGTTVGSVEMAIKDMGFLLKIEDWCVKPRYTDDNTVAK